LPAATLAACKKGIKNSKQEVAATQTYLGYDKNKKFSAAVPIFPGINV
jgi:hypothetical protein